MRLPRLSFSLRTLLLAVALVAIAIGTYCLLVEYPARWRRVRRAESLVRAQLELLQRLAEHERKLAGDERERAERNRLQAQDEEAEAARFPEDSADRQQHETLARLWGAQAEGAISFAKRADQRGSTYQARFKALTSRWQKSRNDVAKLEALAREAEMRLADEPWAEFPPELFLARSMIRVAQRLHETGRSSFPTSFGPRRSVYEATAIWSAESLFKGRFPNATARASQASPSHPFHWGVTFTDVPTGREFRVNTGFSESMVYDYLKANP